MSLRLVIRPHDPWRRIATLVLLLAILLLAGWLLYGYGRAQAGFDNAELIAERDRLAEQLRRLERENTELRGRNTVLNRTIQIDRQAYAQVEQSLKELQDELLELREEVVFYRGIVAPAETARGLNVTSFKLEPIDQERAYRFKLVLTQLKQNDRVVRGKARIYVDGIVDGVRRQLGLKGLSGGVLDDLRVRFRFFQNIEGDIVLPEGFVPSRVVVEVLPLGKGAVRLKKAFDWSEVIG